MIHLAAWQLSGWAAPDVTALHEDVAPNDGPQPGFRRDVAHDDGG